ncbi:tetratricopeptide repeat-containing serine/threonine-protein kinase [bacterium]|nr:tetratricopeptide repeat-containing serine/threonine-protein kinase [bacterium]
MHVLVGQIDLLSGTHLGERYEILSPLGSGGMGQVYRARDLRLGRDVAIKVLPEHLAKNQDARSRFEREARALAALSHPNILTIHDFITHDGVSFAVMELLKGETLRARLAHSKPAWNIALKMGIAIAEGLAAAHSEGVIHRDLKPENIFVTTDGGIKILDFGLARLETKLRQEENSRAATESLLTQSGIVMGTIPYMSPEQVRGETVDSRSDIFSFGVIVYEMLTGVLAFSRRSSAETIAAILKEDPLEAKLLEGYPPGLVEVVSVCLKKNPEERFHTAHDLAFALKIISDAGTVTVAPLPRSIVRRIKPKTVLWITELMVFLILSGLFYRHLSGPGSVKTIHSLAVLPFVNGSPDPNMEYLSDGFTDSIINSVSQLPELRVMARGTVFTYKGKEFDPRKVGRDLHVDAVVTGRIAQQSDTLIVNADLVRVSDGTQLWGKQFKRKFKDILEIQEEISLEITSGLQSRLSLELQKRLTRHHTEDTEAYRLYLKGKYHFNKFTLEHYEKSRDYLEEAIERDPSYALAYSELSLYYQAMAIDGYRLPIETMPRAESAAKKAIAIDETLAEAHDALSGVRFYYDWNWPGYEQESRRALELNPNFAGARVTHTQYLRALGRWEQAIAEAKSAEKIDPLSIMTNKALAAAFHWSHQYDLAIKQYRYTLDLDPNFPEAYASLAEIYDDTGMFGEAITAMQRYLMHAGDEEGAVVLGDDFQAHGYHIAMRSLYHKTLEGLKKSSENGNYVSPMNFAYIYAYLGDKDQAFAWLEKAYQERSPWLTNLKVDPQFENLRTDSRFKILLRRIGLLQ